MKLIFYFNTIKNTGVLIDPNKKFVRKFSSDYKSSILLKNETRGLYWYEKKIKKNKKFKVSKTTKKKPFIDFPLIKGREISYASPLSDNYDYANKVINYYKKFWPTKKITPCHGDLTFANIIFEKNNLSIIDWENFILKEEWGYDICYFLISSLTLPYIIKHKKILKEKDLLVFEKLWRNFYKENRYKYSKNPTKYIKDSVKKLNLRNYSSFYLNKLSKNQINQINEIIN
jgi:thiamine kinase-like enzyme